MDVSYGNWNHRPGGVTRPGAVGCHQTGSALSADGRISASAMRFTPDAALVNPSVVEPGVPVRLVARKQQAVSPDEPLTCPRIVVEPLATSVTASLARPCDPATKLPVTVVVIANVNAVVPPRTAVAPGCWAVGFAPEYHLTMMSRPDAPAPPGSYVTVIDVPVATSRHHTSATPPDALASPARRVHVPLRESVTAPSDDADPAPLPMPTYATSKELFDGVKLAVVMVAVFAEA